MQPADLNKEQGHGVHDGTTAPKVIKTVVSRSSNGEHQLRPGVILDVVDLDGEAGVLEQAIWKGTAARTLW
jgi:hypothetical protein